MKASIIICSYDRADSLNRTLQYLTQQTMPLSEIEIVIVDDGSTDNTAEVCLSYEGKIPQMKYTSTARNKGIGNARNIGYRLCSAKKILYLDDDCIPYPNWAECMIKALDKHDIVAGALTSEEDNYLKLSHNIAVMNAFLPTNRKGYHQFIAGANMGFQQAALEDLDGFQEGRRIAEDMEFSLRARQQGYRIFFAADAVVTHDHDCTQLKDIFQYPLDHAIETIKLRNQYRGLLGTPFVLRSVGMLRLLSPVIAMQKIFEIYFGNIRNLKYIKTLPLVFLLKLVWCWGAARGLLAFKKE